MSCEYIHYLCNNTYDIEMQQHIHVCKPGQQLWQILLYNMSLRINWGGGGGIISYYTYAHYYVGYSQHKHYTQDLHIKSVSCIAYASPG